MRQLKILTVFTCVMVVGLCGESAFGQTKKIVDPKEVSGLALWLKADTLTSQADGQEVTNWPDGSGQNHNATLAAGKLAPVWVRNALNGQPALRFKVRLDPLSGSALITTPIELAKTHAFFVVAREFGGTAEPLTAYFDNGVFLWYEPAALEPKDQGPAFGLGNLSTLRDKGERVIRVRNYYKGGNLVDSRESIDAKKTHLYCLVADEAGTKVWVDGKPIAFGRDMATAIPNRFAGANGPFRIGQHGAGDGRVGQYFNGEIAEIMVVNQALSEEQRHDLEAYFATKYKLSIAPNE
jgi:hypothetical protein